MNVSRQISNQKFCADELRTLDADRYLIALFQPRQIRRYAIALAAWNLELSRVRPHSGEQTLGLIRLQWHSDALNEIKEGRPRHHPVIEELAFAHGAGIVDTERLQNIIDARERDINPAPAQNIDELENYARATGGALHAELWRNTPVEKLAEDVGTGYALIGIARSELINAARGRPWLPEPIEQNLKLIIERGITLGAKTAPTGYRAAMAPAILVNAYAKRARRAGFDYTSPTMQAPDPNRTLRMIMAKLLRKI